MAHFEGSESSRSVAPPYPTSIQWWFEHPDVFPDSLRREGTEPDDTPRELGLQKWVLGEIERLLGMVHVALYLVKPDTLDFHVQTVNDPARRSELEQVGAEQIHHCMFAWALKSGRPAVVESPAASRHSNVIILPLLTASAIIGVCLILRDKAHGDFSLEQLKILSVLGSQFAFLMENQRLFHKLETQNQDLECQVRQRTSELEESLSSLEQLNQEILQATKLKTKFLATTSHELRTPLNSIIGFLHLLKDGLYDNEQEHDQYVRHALESAQHLLTLINDLLDVAKIEAGKMTVDSEQVPLVDLFEEVRVLMEVQAQQKGLSLAFEVPHPGLAVRADSRRLKQVLVNLVGNAIKFTLQGSVRVRAEQDAEANCCVLSIVDTGIGIATGMLAGLGKAFAQGDSDSGRRFGGSGLGLAISRGLIELMGGTLSITSPGEGLGTAVTVRLPLCRAAIPIAKELPSQVS